MLEGGERLRVRANFTPVFFVEGSERDLTRLRQTLARHPSFSRNFSYRGKEVRRDIWTGQNRDVDAVALHELENAKPALAHLYRQFPDLVYHNCDLPIGSLFCYQYDVFPLGKCEVNLSLNDGDGYELLSIRSVDDPWDTNYPTPPFRHAKLKAEGVRLEPDLEIGRLTLETEERTLSWEGEAPRLVLHDLNRILTLDDPDVIWTEGGDSMLLPLLFALGERFSIPLALDRERGADGQGIKRRITGQGRTIESYGRTLYMAPDYPLYGRWHIDSRNSFWAGSTGLSGLVEIVRVCKLPPQRTSRRSIGNALTSMQCEAAWKGGFLIPWRKTQVEGWKSAVHLARSDRGGLVFQPAPGAYEDVVEVDFASMFPTIMYKRRVSPELINCNCCDNEAVPGLGYTICEKRYATISGVLGKIVKKRAEYKKMRAAAKRAGREDDYQRFNNRQDAFKWVLVCCFGYLGYRNARFGKIEAHESTTAFSRELLLQSKEIVEDYGFHVIHANVDCFWMQRPGGVTDPEIEKICEEIEEQTQLPLGIEGRYSWIVFLPSRQDPNRPVPSRFFGRFQDGTFKYRGIELRRSDVCGLVKQLQRDMLDILADAESLAECRARRNKLEVVAENYLARVRTGDVAWEELIIRQRLSKCADEYKGNSKVATAARQAKQAGLLLEAGQTAGYAVIDNKHPLAMERIRLHPLISCDDTYDAPFYEAQIIDAAETILQACL